MQKVLLTFILLSLTSLGLEVNQTGQNFAQAIKCGRKVYTLAPLFEKLSKDIDSKDVNLIVSNIREIHNALLTIMNICDFPESKYFMKIEMRTLDSDSSCMFDLNVIKKIVQAKEVKEMSLKAIVSLAVEIVSYSNQKYFDCADLIDLPVDEEL